MPQNKLHLLVLEDVPNDAALEIAELEQAGYECDWKRVETRADFLAELDEGGYDLVISDYALPAFDGLTALKLLQERRADMPFILVSGTLGEEAAIDSLRAGATDYVLKTRLSRLGPVVERALHEQAQRRERERAQRELQLANERFRAIVENAGDAIITVDEAGRMVEWNAAAALMFGYTAEEAIGREVLQIMPERYRADHQNSLLTSLSGHRKRKLGETTELTGRRKDGTEFALALSLAAWMVDGEHFFTAIIRDITERKAYENALKQHNVELEQFNRMATGRELRMIELKNEVNALCRELGREEPYGM